MKIQMKNKIFTSLLGIALCLSGGTLYANVTDTQKVPSKISLLLPDRTLQLNFKTQPALLTEKPQHFITIGSTQIPISINDQLLVKTSDYLTLDTTFKTVINKAELHKFFVESGIFQSKEVPPIEIKLDPKTKKITFSGKPDDGFDVDEDKLIVLLNKALETGKTNVRVPARKVFSTVIVPPELEKQGIKEVLAVGKSNFRGSSPARRQNIRAAAQRFQGQIIKKDETFSFNTILGSVDEKYGFVKELVIKGNKNEKELGGGVCQVSTTAFRAAFTGGFPIVERRSHSYSVPYYKPFGIDAMIYLGFSDFKFKNDTPGNILIQTFIEGNNLYFIYYGTRDNRDINFEGPFISHYQEAPPVEVFETTDLAPGETKWVSNSHAGFVSKWVRRVYKDGKKKEYTLKSNYRPWPAQMLKGVELPPEKISPTTFSKEAEVSKSTKKTES